MLPVLSTNKTNSTNNNQQQNNGSSNSKNNSSLKRTASMIFRIEHLLPSTSNSNSSNSSIGSTNSQQQQQQKLHKNLNAQKTKRNSAQMNSAGVFVSQFTAKGSVSEFLSPAALMSISCAGDMKEQQQQQAQRVFCNLSEGVLCMTPHILRQIRLADDIHSYNALMELQKGQVRLRIVQDLSEDDEIIVWFCEQMSILMSIPFLTLQNIQGDKQYTCHVCQRNFETPHPLKLHLALACDRNSIDILYIRLYYAVTFNQQQQMLGSVSSAHNTLPAASSVHNEQEQRYSAFKPIKTTTAATLLTTATPAAAAPIFTSSHNTNSTHTATSILTTMPAPLTFLPSMSMEQLTASSNASTINAAAQIEAIVSNMGASKRGHLCLYCGKCYSRKYGLKIHIRTHTGFKPLKCKFCLRPFGDPSNLNKHVRLHLQTNAISMRTEVHKCHLCHKALARRRDLQRHLESRHAGESL